MFEPLPLCYTNKLMTRNFSENVSWHLLHDGVDGTGCIVLNGSIVVGSYCHSSKCMSRIV